MYQIGYAPAARAHLQALPAHHQAIVLTAILRHLVHHPLHPCRNRKPLRPNDIAPWELRVGQLRILFEVQNEPEPEVHILLVGYKRGNQLIAERQAISLA